MNKHAFRLVFDRRRGMRVPAAEHTRSAGKAAGGATRSAVVAVAALLAWPLDTPAQTSRPPVVFASKLAAPTYNLPQPYGTTPVRQGDGTFRVRSDRPFVADPAKAPFVSWTVDGKTGTFDQGSVERVILNWDSFDIGAGYKVHFKQDKDPSRYVSALNRIWSLDPSVILGSLTADREVILLNANGVYFGRGARVDTGKFVATTLGIADAVFEKGLRNVTDGSAVFSTSGADYLPTNLDASVSVEAGAEIRSAAGGDVLLIAPRVVNQGRIETPNGQTVLAAGDKVYLMSSSDPAQRGLIVAVDPVKVAVTTTDPLTGVTSTEQMIDRELGIVENAARGSYKTVDGQTVADDTPDATSGLVRRINEIAADSGTINLVGLTVRQNGNLRATTAVKGANGAIYLQAQESTAKLSTAGGEAANRGFTVEGGSTVTVGERLGTVVIGSGSSTRVDPSADDTRTQFDSEVFNPSIIRIEGKSVHVESGAQVLAPSGRISLLASANASVSPLFIANGAIQAEDDSRLVIDPGATISAAGLRDVAIDGARNQGSLRLFRIELADAPVQRGGPLYRSNVFFDLRNADSIKVADVGGATNALGRSARERSTAAGNIRIEGDGAVVVGEGASLDVSGGSIAYSAATLKTSLLGDQGRVVQFEKADAGQAYDTLLPTTSERFVPAYVEGKDGGSLNVSGRRMVFDAEVRAGVVEGEYQRDGRTQRALPAQLSFGRELGGSQYLQGIRLDADDTYTLPGGFFADPFGASLDRLPSTLDLSLARLQDSGAGRIALRANTVEQMNFGTLALGAGGKLDVLAQYIALDGAFSAPGGTISLATANAAGSITDPVLGDIVLSERASLSTAGLWTNDSALAPVASRSTPAPVQLGGGTIDIAAQRSLRAPVGASIDASAGAWLPADGKVQLGKAGSISLRIGAGLPAESRELAQLTLGATLNAVDFSSGGSLTLGVPQLRIADAPDPAAPDAFGLAPEFFSSGGFGSVAVSSFGDVTLASGAQLAPQLSNWVLGSEHRRQGSGAMRPEVATAQQLDEQLVDRKPVNVSLAATRPINAALGLAGASVQVERGASIVLEEGGVLKLQATRSIGIGATGGEAGDATALVARGGEISLRTTGVRGAADPNLSSDDPAGFVADQAIWIGRDTTLDVSGSAELRRSATQAVLFQPGTSGVAPAPAQTGAVLGGGKLNLEAGRGYVVAEAGSMLNLDGFAAPVTLPGQLGSTLVAKSAGTLTVTSAEGFVLDGEISARAPRGPNGAAVADGGRLVLALGAGGVSSITAANPYPDGGEPLPRQVVVDDFERVVDGAGAKFGDDLQAKLGNGIGRAPKRVLTDAGFDAVTLRAGDLLKFEGDLNLTTRLAIELDAPAIESHGGAQVRLSAPAVTIGNLASRTPGAPAPDTSASPDLAPGAGTRLQVDADAIDVIGHVGLKGFSNVALNADAQRNSEVRLVGLVGGDGRNTGSLGFAGRLDIVAGQVSAASGSAFGLSGLESWEGEPLVSTLTFSQPTGGSSSLAPLSAFGSLSATATDIVQAGVLRQPFGAISLTASRQLTLAAGSVTSVSADGAVIPFGTTNNLSEWQAFLLGELAALPIEKRIRLTAPTLVSDPGATVSARGGGDVQASEFFPGVGGSTDYLATAGLYAVLPDYDFRFAPRPEGGGVSPIGAAGSQIEITMSGSGLAPGRYTLLPASYVLLGGSLPRGAFLVRLASDQGSTVLNAPIRQDDGGVVVTGYLTQPGSIATGTPGQRFVVEGEPTARAKAEYRLSGISDFLASRAAQFGTAVPVLPRDAGSIQIEVGSDTTTVLSAALDLAAPNGARAGTLDIAAPKIALVDALVDTPAGYLGVSAANLEATGAGSVLLGGLRSDVTGADAASRVVEIDSGNTTHVRVATEGRPVTLNELILAASERVTIDDGSSVAATSGASRADPRTLRFKGDGAAVLLSAQQGADLLRSDTTLLGGAVEVGSAVKLSAAQLDFDSTGLLAIDPSAALSAGSLGFAARRLVIGTLADSGDATRLDGSVLDAARSAESLRLRSYSSIDFVGAQDFAQRATTVDGAPGAATKVFKQLILDAPNLRGLDLLDANGAVVQAAQLDVAAQDVVLRNSSLAPDPASGVVSPVRADATLSGRGSLLIEALPPQRYGVTGGLVIGSGEQRLNFAEAQLRSAGDIVLDGNGSLSAQGDLSLGAARVTATSRAEHAVKADGTLVIDQLAGARSLGERTGQGAKLDFSGQTIVQRGTIDLAAGRIGFDAVGTAADAAAIRFEAGSLTSAAGFGVQAQEGWTVFADAGQVSARAGVGRIDVLGTIDVGAAQGDTVAPGQGNAGTVALSATGAGGTVVLSEQRLASDGSSVTVTGHLRGASGAAAGDLGGRFSLDVRGLDPRTQSDGSVASTLDGLVRGLGEGGFTREVDVRIRTGDAVLDENLRAQRIGIAADAGSLRIGAITLDADAAQGGVVQLAAGRDVSLDSGARIEARSTRDGANGGDVLLASGAGRIRLASGTSIDAGGDDSADGRIVLRAQRGADNRSVAIDSLAGVDFAAGEVDLEAFKVYKTVTVNGVTAAITTIAAGNNAVAGTATQRTGTLGQASVRADNNAFMSSASSILEGLGVSAAQLDQVHLRAGVEVQADSAVVTGGAAGSLTIASDWQLNAERPGGDAGFLTLRATGNLLVNNSLSDGFVSAASTAALNGNARSWSYRLTAGADLSGADLLATRQLAEGSAETGNLTIAAGKLVRTGAGSIEMAAGRDIVFGGSATTVPGMVYVAGRQHPSQNELRAGLFGRQTAKPTFTEQGGRLELEAERDITSPVSGQLINNWLWRSGLATGTPGAIFYSPNSQLAWWTEFSRLQQPVGSFGGGNVRVSAGNDVKNLSVLAPTSAWADSQDASQAHIVVNNGGDVDVHAGRDVVGGQFLVGRGEGRIEAGGSVRAADSGPVVAPILALMQGHWDVAARGDLTLAGVINPTAVALPSADGRTNVSGTFYTYAEDGALRATSVAGDLSLTGMSSAALAGYRLDTSAPSALPLFSVAPPTLALAALGGDVSTFANAQGDLLLFPSAVGDLKIFAGQDIHFGAGSSASRIAMADTRVDAWPTTGNPLSNVAVKGLLAGTNGQIELALDGDLGHTDLHRDDMEPARIAAFGSIRSSAASSLDLPKAAQISAGQDIDDLNFTGQNQRASDVTRIEAGRNLTARQGGIVLGGPGTLEVVAGRQVDLGASRGIVTIGNEANATLPSGGASVRLAAGTAGTLRLEQFERAYLEPVTLGLGSARWQQHREALQQYVQAELRDSSLSYEAALAAFASFPVKAQVAFARRVLAQEFGATYLSGAAPTVAAFTQSLQERFEVYRTSVLAAGQQALDAGQSLTLPGREVLSGEALRSYLAALATLKFADIDVGSSIAQRVTALSGYAVGWKSSVAAEQGLSIAQIEAIGTQDPTDARYLRYQQGLTNFSGASFERFRDTVLVAEMASAGSAASNFGLKTLPVRMAFYDQGFLAAELAGIGNFEGTSYWTAPTASLAFSGTMNLTQSSVVTRRGGDISLINPGGPINVGLKDAATGGQGATGVIALGGGDVVGFARDDIQVNNQRVFVVGHGDMTLWSSRGDIDSGRGANTAVAAPPLTARRSNDGVVFEVPATTTGSGLGILEDANGQRSGTIGLYPAFGEILALDAFIRAPAVVLGSSIKGADNLVAVSVGGAAAPVAAPALSIGSPPAAGPDNKTGSEPSGGQQGQDGRQRSSLLTVELLGLGSGADDECVDPKADPAKERRKKDKDGKCPP
jgi:filamentous hemagglutinin family protein